MNGSQVLYVNPGYFKCIFGINVSPANKNIFIISFILPSIGILPTIISSPFASCSLINFDFLLIHSSHSDKSIILPFLVLKTSGVLLSDFPLHFKQ